MLTAAEVRRLDANSAFLGVPVTQLMRNAGNAVAQEAARLIEPGAHVLVGCGLGNNGGDGFAAARSLAMDHQVTVVVAGPADGLRSLEASTALAEAQESGVKVLFEPSPAALKRLARESALVVDAFLGVGSRPVLRPPLSGYVRAITDSGTKVLSVDSPTGLGGRLAVKPSVTVTFHAPKVGMTKSNSGRIVVADIGIPPKAESHCGPGDLLSWWRPNAPGGHKGQHGRLLIVAGGPYGGAPLLASAAALRAGIDMVRLYTPSKWVPVAQGALPDLVTHPGQDIAQLVEADVPVVAGLLPKVDAVLLGPGLGRSVATDAAVRGILSATRKAKMPIILDADALPVARGGKDLGSRPVLLTPHARELRAFTGRALPKGDAAASARLLDAARVSGATILLKGPVDRIADDRRVRLNTVHHAAMTRGGTGDVLAGVAAAYVARGASTFDAACASAFVVGYAGVRLATRWGHGLLASDLPDEVARVMNEITAPAD
jgi:ADP-dependent NAD(P)H-hydrate dehydratase / NAD(P)H-hydrate epimerase